MTRKFTNSLFKILLAVLLLAVLPETGPAAPKKKGKKKTPTPAKKAAPAKKADAGKGKRTAAAEDATEALLKKRAKGKGPTFPGSDPALQDVVMKSQVHRK